MSAVREVRGYVRVVQFRRASRGNVASSSVSAGTWSGPSSSGHMPCMKQSESFLSRRWPARPRLHGSLGKTWCISVAGGLKCGQVLATDGFDAEAVNFEFRRQCLQARENPVFHHAPRCICGLRHIRSSSAIHSLNWAPELRRRSMAASITSYSQCIPRRRFGGLSHFLQAVSINITPAWV